MFSISIQAGGLSSRMGVNKALMPFNGLPLILRVLERVGSLSDDIFITSNDTEQFTSIKIPVYPDVQPGMGALGGLITAFHHARYDAIAVLACDMPFIQPDLLKAEYDLLLKDGSDIVIPRTIKGLEPLHAVYRVSACLPPAKAALNAGKKRLISWFPEVRVREMGTDEIELVDLQALSFLNVNTIEEFKDAENLARILER
jgi:molybdenum cofactor guanylyltransferase